MLSNMKKRGGIKKTFLNAANIGTLLRAVKFFSERRKRRSASPNCNSLTETAHQKYTINVWTRLFAHELVERVTGEKEIRAARSCHDQVFTTAENFTARHPSQG